LFNDFLILFIYIINMQVVKMKILYILFFMIISTHSNAASEATPPAHLSELPIVETFMGNRRTNVECHPTLYPHLNLAKCVNCHPYNPTDVMDSPLLPACASHPLVVKYTPSIVRDILPEHIKAMLDAAGPTCQLFLNVQDNSWNGTPIQLRAHAFSDFFPAMDTSYGGVTALVPLLNTTDSVYPHGGVASPSNFTIAGLNHTNIEEFYSSVGYGGRTVITRHLLLTVPVREIFQELLCAPATVDRSLSFFSPLLGPNYATFLGENGII
jgi:hypothetical protein